MKDAIQHNLDPVADLGQVSARWCKTINVGRCNFCTSDSSEVLEVKGCHLMVRICRKCFNTIKMAAK